MHTRSGDWLERIAAMRPSIAAGAAEAERERRLPAAVAEALATSGLMRMAAPGVPHGGEASPVEQVEAIEAVSRIDGSAGWNLMIAIESFGLIGPGFRRCMALLDDPATVICGSTAAVGQAVRDGAGYRISGRWPFVSGCHNSAVFCATVTPSEPVPGSPLQRLYAVVERPHFTILDTWNVGGLCGSGSHDVVVEDAWVDESRMVAPIGGNRTGSPLLRFPLGARLAYNKVAVALGIARAAVDAFVELATRKAPRFDTVTLRDRPFAQRAVATSEVRILAARALLMDQVEALWRQVVAGAPIDRQALAIFQIACSDGVRGCVEAVEAVCEAAGTSANERGTVLERAARDIRVVRQHVTVAPQHIEDAGRVLLGLEPGGAMLRGPLAGGGSR